MSHGSRRKGSAAEERHAHESPENEVVFDWHWCFAPLKIDSGKSAKFTMHILCKYVSSQRQVLSVPVSIRFSAATTTQKGTDIPSPICVANLQQFRSAQGLERDADQGQRHFLREPVSSRHERADLLPHPGSHLRRVPVVHAVIDASLGYFALQILGACPPASHAGGGITGRAQGRQRIMTGLDANDSGDDRGNQAVRT